MKKVILAHQIIDAGYQGAKDWKHKSIRLNDTESDKREEVRWALEAAIPAYLDSDEPGVWQYGVNYRSIIGGPFDRFEWFKTREIAVERFKVYSHPRGAYRDRGDGHGLAVRPCRRWVGRPFFEESFDELDEFDHCPEGRWFLHDATPEQAEEIFDKVTDYIYEVAEKMSDTIDVTGALNMGGQKNRVVRDEKEVPLP